MSTLCISTNESCERSSSREENDPVHSFTAPTKRIKKTKTKTIPLFHDDKMERKADKKKRYAESALWKRRHHKEFQRNRDRKYAEPLDDPLDFSAESFSSELSSREAHEFYIEHTETLYSRGGTKMNTRILMRGTIYCTPNSVLRVGYTRKNDPTNDIAVIHSMHKDGCLTPVRQVYRGDWATLETHIMADCQYRTGDYNMLIK